MSVQTRSFRRGSALVVTVALLMACGDGGSGVGDAAAAPLAARVAAVRQAAANDPGAAALQLVALREEVGRFQAEGSLSDGAAERILEAAADVEEGLAAITPATTAAPPTTTPPPTTSPPPPADDDDDDDGRGRSKGKGGDKDDD